MNVIKRAAQAAIAIIILSGAAAIAAPNIADAVTAFSRTTTVTGLGSVTCPSGWHVTGGGYDGAASTYDSTVTVGTSRPTSNGWYTRAKITRYPTNRRPYTNDYSLRVYAICVR